MKIFNIILAILFLLFAAVQFNDSPGDILFWVIVYAGVGIISAFAAFNRYNMWAILLGLAVVVFEMFRKFPTFALWVSDGMPSIVDERLLLWSDIPYPLPIPPALPQHIRGGIYVALRPERGS